MNLIATRSLKYGTRRLLPGDSFVASNTNGRLLIAIKKAKIAPADEIDQSDPPDTSETATNERRRSPKRSKES